MDADKPQNAKFLEHYPVITYPTLLVVDPAQERAVLKWLGTLNVTQLDQLLLDGQRAIQGGQALDKKLAQADGLNASSQSVAAIAAYRELLKEAPQDWPWRTRVTESLLLAAASAGDSATCTDAARALAPGMPRGPSFANVVSTGLSCALDLPPDAPGRAAAVAGLETLGNEAVLLPDLLADDRAGLYSALVEARRDARDDAGMLAAATRAWEFLEREARAAPNVEARASLDGFRVETALALKDPGRALPHLLQSERDLPQDSNPPARIAVLLRELGQLDKAEAAARRALARVYGPRRVRVLETLAGILVKQGRPADARAAYQEALGVNQQVPAARRNPGTEDRLRKAMAELPTPP